jgi:5-formyltetrahydrofolate cyclo-ligase
VIVAKDRGTGENAAPRSKSEHRADTRAARSGLSDESRSEAARAVAERAFALPGVLGARTVLAYAPTAEELDPSPILTALRSRGARVAYPRVCGPGALAMHWCGDPAELAPGYCGIAEPSAESPEATPDEFDLVLVPGTAFDEACDRIGMGGGFYDRLLPLLAPGALAIGLAFDEQIVPEVPTEAHDARLGAVITPSRMILPRG